MNSHEFIEVAHRRWCVACDLFQIKRNGVFADPSGCPRDSIYAMEWDAKQLKSLHKAIAICDTDPAEKSA